MSSDDLSQIVETLHPFEVKVLEAFPEEGKLLDRDVLKKSSLSQAQLDMAFGWLLAKKLICIHQEEMPDKKYSLTETGHSYATVRIPELRIKKLLEEKKALTIDGLRKTGELEQEEISEAIGQLKKDNLISIAEGGAITLVEEDVWIRYQFLQDYIEHLKKEQSADKIPEGLRGREKWIEHLSRKKGAIFKSHKEIIRQCALTAQGKEIVTRLKGRPLTQEASQLTPEDLKTGAWRDKQYRKYNISLRPSRVAVGKKHPYREFLDSVKATLVAMGFQEMRGPLVECEFWNMDALYMPQSHPARDIHDVYFIKEPRSTRKIAEPYLSQVSATHENGWKTGSRGWGYVFDATRTKRLILRSQGTAVSARTLAGGPQIPGKYFAIARCFRYEQVDVTHATDFFQVEGIVLGSDITFRTLLGLLSLFGREVARAQEIKFLPAYFPFTEPSVELHVRHPKLGWMELGGAGLFRPEVTLPLGVRVPVIAWGLGLDRMAMVALDVHDIRDLFSPDLDLIRTKRVTV